MLLTLDPKARQLADYMSDLSEEAWYAGWMEGLEFELWDAVVAGPRDYGRLQVTHEHIERLRQLSDSAGGRIIFQDHEEEMLLPMEDWQERFRRWKTGRGCL